MNYFFSMGTNSLSGSGFTITLSTAHSSAVGNLMALGISDGGSGSCTVTDSVGNTYAVIPFNVSTARVVYLAYTTITNTVSIGTVITATFDISTSARRIAADLFGGQAASPLDTSLGGTGNSASPNSGNITTAGSGELLYGVTCFGNAGVSMTPGTTGGDTYNKTAEFQQGGAGNFLETQYIIKSGTGTVSNNGTITSALWATLIAAFKPIPVTNTAGILPFL